MKKLVVIASTLTLLMGLSVTSAKASPNELSNLNADSELYNAVGWQMAKVTQKQATDVVSFLKTKVLPSTRLTSAQKATLINKAITQLTANEPYHPSRVSSYGVKALSNIATIVSASGVLNALQKQSLMVRSIGKVIYINGHYSSSDIKAATLKAASNINKQANKYDIDLGGYARDSQSTSISQPAPMAAPMTEKFEMRPRVSESHEMKVIPASLSGGRSQLIQEMGASTP